ncbi:MAG TPA: molybdopterin molybdotransferase MoeA, partial [Phycisphaerales bacterium]|nr:molybdopterin molybdotransferase MoeA [Phycisphaerales bacterium]
MNDRPVYQDALHTTLESIKPLGERVQVNLMEAIDLVLAASIHTDRDLPPFNRSAMDGYAFRASSWRQTMPVHATIAAGQRYEDDTPVDACVEIATGAAVPELLDVVVPHEHTDRGNPVTFDFADAPPIGGCIHARGADAAKGDVVVQAGTVMGAVEVGLAALVGVTAVEVHRRPRVAIFTSGDELVNDSVAPGPHQIRNSNGPMVQATVERCGGDVVHRSNLPDTRNAVHSAIEAILPEVDLIVTTGGISAGRADYIPDAMELLGCRWLVSGVRMQPGKPVRTGR